MQIIFHYRLLQDNGDNSLCFTVKLYCICILSWGIIFKYLFIYLAMLGLNCSSCDLPYSTWALCCHTRDLPCIIRDTPCISRDLPCITWDLPCVTQDLTCIMQDLRCVLLTLALRCVGSVVMSIGLSCPTSCRILAPWLGMKHTSHALEGKFLTTRPPGKSLSCI